MVVYRSIILICFAFLFFSCKKEEIKISEVPSITFNNLSPSSIQEFDGPIVFTINYIDGDGDLGENTAGIKNLFLKDNRNKLVYEYRFQQLAPDNSNITIQGSLSIELVNTAITNDSNEQTATFDIYVVDRAGNRSNTITSSVLSIYR